MTTILRLTLLAALQLASLAEVAPPQNKPNTESAASGDEDMILGFRGKSKYQIVVPDAAANLTLPRPG